MLILAFLPFDAFAQISIISDEETEQYLASVIRPLFQQAGVPFNRNKIYIVNDNSLMLLSVMVIICSYIAARLLKQIVQTKSAACWLMKPGISPAAIFCVKK